MSLKVCHISTAHSDRDIRIFHKECKTLAENGFEVYYIVNSTKQCKIEGVNIIPLPYLKNRFSRIFIKVWIALLKAVKLKAKVYHFHDPEFIFMGLILKMIGKTVIYDIHEDVAQQILTKEWLGPKLFRKFMSSLYSLLEKLAINRFDLLIAATPEIAKKYPKEKTLTLRNLPITDKINAIPDDKKCSNKKTVAIYAGGLTEIRGIKEIIQAANILNGKIELRLFGQWENEILKNECEQLEGWKFTDWKGFLSIDEVYREMKNSDIGLVNFLPEANHIKALPNKPFEYMACGIPMVMSNFDYWKEIFGECAVFADPTNPYAIAKQIEFLLKNKDISNEMGKRGKELIKDEFSWEAESMKLVYKYKDLCKDHN